MHYIQRLPFILGAAAAIIAGILSYELKNPQKDIYIRMTISMVVFFALGAFIRATVFGIKKEIEEKEALEKQEELMNLKGRKAGGSGAVSSDDGKAKGENIDLKVDQSSEEFTPLKVNEIYDANAKKSAGRN